MPRQDQIIYNESALTLEKLSILKAWAEVYIASMKNETIIRTELISGDLKADEKIENNEEDDFGDFESTRFVLRTTVFCKYFLINDFYFSDSNRNDILSKPSSGDVSGGGSLASLVQVILFFQVPFWLLFQSNKILQLKTYLFLG
jgi:hypothetical protein